MNNTEFLKGIAHELKFWKGFVKTERFLEGWVKQDKTPELNQLVYDFIIERIPNGPNTKVLDVGSGVVSILNGCVHPETLTAADPLGGLYESIFDYEKYNIKPCVPVPAEEMEWRDEFDIVHMSNAIDHVQDPEKVLFKLIDACKPGGYVILQGFENEGTFEKWEGFHQWDLTVIDGVFYIKAKNLYKNEINVFAEKTIICEHFNNPNGKTWYIWIIQK